MPPEIDTGIRFLERFSQTLLAQRYSPATVNAYRGKCRRFIVWLYLGGIPISATDENVRHRFLNHDCACARPIFFRKPGCFNASGRDGYRIGKFLDFLASEGVVEGNPQPPRPEKPDGHLAAFLDWLRRHRGVGEQTLSNYRRFVSALLLDLGDDPERYDAAMIRDALLRRVKTGSRGQARNLTVSLRMCLRYLASAGKCPSGLVHAVPTIPDRSSSTLPRYVSSDDIERTIASCDATTATGSRDKAVLLLFARLALRAGDVANLRLTDIDWNEATIRVSGKSRSRMRLPRPRDGVHIPGVLFAHFILTGLLRRRAGNLDVCLDNLARHADTVIRGINNWRRKNDRFVHRTIPDGAKRLSDPANTGRFFLETLSELEHALRAILYAV